MATGNKEVTIKLILDAAGAITGAEKVEAALDKVEKKNKDSAKGMQDAWREARGGVVGIVNDLTGGMASKFMDVKEAIGGATMGLKGFKAVLIGTGIGALVVALGAIVGYKDDLVLMFSESAQEFQEFNAQADKYIQLQETTATAWGHEERRLRAQGVAQDEILKLRRNDINLQLMQLETSMQQQEAAMKLLLIQEAAIKKQPLGFVTAWWFGTDEKKAEQDAKYNETKAKIEELKTRLIETDGEIAAEKEKAEEKKQTAVLKTQKIEEEAVKRKVHEMDTIDARTAQSVGVQQVNDQLAVNSTARAEYEKQQAAYQANEARRKNLEAVYDLEMQKMQKNLSMFTDVTNGMLALNELFTGNSEKSARKSFAMTKAMNVAQAIASTFAAVNAQLAVPQDAITGANYIKAGLALATGLANVKRIMSTKFQPSGGTTPSPSGGGGGGSFAGGGGFSGGMTAPQPIAPMTPSLTQTGNQPVQAYVLAGNVVDSTEARAKIARQARL